MAFLTDWVQNIAYYMIFVTVLISLLPARSYEKYIRFFAGIVLILLVLKPFLGGMHLEKEMVRFYQEFSFKQDTRELERQILGAEEQQKKTVMERYEQAVGEELSQIAKEFDLETKWVEIKIEDQKEHECFGRVTKIRMGAVFMGNSKNDEEKRLESLKAKNRLKEEIIEYYRVEDSHVEIQLEER